MQTLPSDEKLVVKLDFDNHTSCQCRQRNADLMPRTQEVVDGPKHGYAAVSPPRTPAPSAVDAVVGRTRAKHHLTLDAVKTQ